MSYKIEYEKVCEPMTFSKLPLYSIFTFLSSYEKLLKINTNKFMTVNPNKQGRKGFIFEQEDDIYVFPFHTLNSRAPYNKGFVKLSSLNIDNLFLYSIKDTLDSVCRVVRKETHSKIVTIDMFIREKDNIYNHYDMYAFRGSSYVVPIKGLITNIH